MTRDARANDTARDLGRDLGAGVLPDLGPMMMGPLTAVRMWADMSRAVSSVMPASLLIAVSPFFWAPPLWVGALMAGQAATPHGGIGGSTATRRDAAAAPARTVAPPAPKPAPQPAAKPAAMAKPATKAAPKPKAAAKPAPKRPSARRAAAKA